MDKSWRHIVLEGAVSTEQMKSIDDCMQEVAIQMQAQILNRENEIRLGDSMHHDSNITFENAETCTDNVEEFIYHQERGLPAAVFSSDVLFQVL
jgi:hypothetical protein